MKVAVVGSRNCANIDFKPHLPATITELVSGGAKGVDSLAKQYAIAESLPYVEFLPDYKRYGRGLLGWIFKRHSLYHSSV